jgi:hypothetical protein
MNETEWFFPGQYRCSGLNGRSGWLFFLLDVHPVTGNQENDDNRPENKTSESHGQESADNPDKHDDGVNFHAAAYEYRTNPDLRNAGDEIGRAHV